MLKMQNIAIILDNQGIQYQSKLTDNDSRYKSTETWKKKKTELVFATEKKYDSVMIKCSVSP